MWNYEKVIQAKKNGNQLRKNETQPTKEEKRSIQTEEWRTLDQIDRTKTTLLQTS
jgi:hypothetical protein